MKNSSVIVPTPTQYAAKKNVTTFIIYDFVKRVDMNYSFTCYEWFIISIVKMRIV